MDFAGQLDDIVGFHIWTDMRDPTPYVFQAPVVHVHKNKAMGFILRGILVECMQNLGRNLWQWESHNHRSVRPGADSWI